MICNALGVNEEDCCVDLYGTQCNRLKKRYWLTLVKANFPIVKSFALASRPIETSVINGIPGNDIYLYDTGGRDFKTSRSKLLVLYLYNIEEISMFIHQYGWKEFIKDSIKLLFKRL